MATNTNVTLTGAQSGLIYDGKKTLTVNSSYGSNSISLSGSWSGIKEGKTTTETTTVDTSKINIVVATTTTKALAVTGGSKSTSIYLGTGGGTVSGSATAGDKFFGNTGKDTFVLAKGDVVGDGKTSNVGYGSGDVIVLEGASLSNLSFTDNYTKKSVVITNGKDKMTVNKNDATTPLTIHTTGDDEEFTYGVDGKKYTTTDGKTLTITNQVSVEDEVNTGMILAGAKSINATAVTKYIYLTGNGQGNNISIGSGGGWLYGGYDTAKKKATSDNLYGTKTGGQVDFYIDSLSGSDNIYNYKEGDVIVIDDGKTKMLDFTGKNFKDGGTGKDISITYDGGKIAVKANTADIVTFDVNGTVQAYGVDLPTGVSVDSKRTALLVGSNYSGTVVGLEGYNNGLDSDEPGYDGDALKTFAPKLNTIVATATTKSVALNAHSTMGTILQSGKAGSKMYGGKGADQFVGGEGRDLYYVDASTTTGKDNITNYGSGDIIVVEGLDDTIREQLSFDAKGVLYFSTDKNAQKNNSVTVKNFKKAGVPIVVTDEEGYVLAVRDANGVPGMKGLNPTLKSGLTTDANFNGQYDNTQYAVGGFVNLSTGKIDNSSLNSTGYGVINANQYGGALKAINASVVADSGLSSLDIYGNASVKNTIYLPNRSKNDLVVNAYGGTNNDTFIGHSTATKTTVYYNMEAGGKDVIEGYNEGDVIVLENVTLTGIAGDEGYGLVNDTRVTEQGSDVVFKFNNKDSLTIKNAAGKKITFHDAVEDAPAYEYGHTLQSGLEYNSKHTAINATASLKDDVQIDLNDTSIGTDFYYTGIKTVSLSAAASTSSAWVIGNKDVVNELYAGSGGATLYGGDKGTSKATADKLYGNTGADVFQYKQDVGADVVGNTKDTKSLFDENDMLVLGSGNASALTADDLTFTDKKTVLTVQYNADKGSKLTVNKASAQTAVKILFADASLNSEDSTAWVIDENNDVTTPSEAYFVYGIDTRTFRADATNIDKGTLNITGAGVDRYTLKSGKLDPVYETIGVIGDDGSTTAKGLAVVNAKYVSSGLKNIGVTDNNLVVSLTGGVSALNVTMGAAGGTLSGGANGTKSFNDKFYSQGNTVFVLDKATGGKDAIYNYNADNGDILYFKDGAPSEVAFSAKSITFSYDGKKSTFTIYPPTGKTFDSNTSVKIGIPVNVEGSEETTMEVKTYFGWDAKQKQFSYYANNVRDDQWTKPDPAGTTFIFHGKNTAEMNLYGTNYTLQGASIKDDNGDYIPDNVELGGSATSSLHFANDDPTLAYIDPIVSGFHIKGQYAYSDSSEQNATATDLTIGDTLIANGVNYKLVQADGNTVNGFELSENGWVKTADDSYVYFSDTAFVSSDNNVKQGKAALGSSFAPITVTGALTDGKVAGADNDILSKFAFNATDAASEITIAVADSDVEISGAQVLLNKSINNITKREDLFKFSNNFVIKTKVGSTGEGDSVGTYKLYEGDNNTVNGYELLRTDLAAAKNWTLETPYDASNKVTQAKASLQADGVGFWQYSDTSTGSPLVFEVDAAAGIKADAKGLPVGIAVGSLDADGAAIEKTKHTIFFADADFNTANITLANDTKVGSETGAVHISGLAVGTQFTVGSATYMTAEFDGDTDNGLELIQTNTKGWTYDAGAWTYDSSKRATLSINDKNVPALKFTISAAASLQADEDGTPKDVEVAVDTSTGIVTLDFSGMSEAHVIGLTEPQNLTNRSDTSLITFGDITTGDVRKTVRIKGFDSNTATFTISDGSFYLANLDDSADNYELLPVNSNWKRTATAWEYYSDGIPTEDTEDILPALKITSLSNGKVSVSADVNGAPKGIKVEGNQFTIDERFGTISGASANNETGGVSLTAAMLEFGAGTAVNHDGIHILGAGSVSSLNFTSDTFVTVGAGTVGEVTRASDTYKLANLDRDLTNGYELLTKDSTNSWTFNNGVIANGKVDTAQPLLGSWTFSSNTAVGSANKIEFMVSEAASLFAVDSLEGEESATVAVGNPRGIFVKVDASSKQATIYADSEIEDSVKSTELIFGGSDTAVALFESGTGVHLVGFAEDDLVIVKAGTQTVSSKATDIIWSYRVKELDGNVNDGFELLKVSDTDVWTLTTDAESGARNWTYNGKDDGITLSASSNMIDANGNSAVTSFKGLYASSTGRPINLEVVPGAGISKGVSDTATLKINQDTETAKLDPTSLVITTNKVGSGTSLHIVGYDSNTTISVNDGSGSDPRTYRLANLDADSSTKELIAYNEDWRYYDTATTLNLYTGSKEYSSGTWIFSKTYDDKVFNLALDSGVALRGTIIGGKYKIKDAGGAIGQAAADANGAPIGVTVSGEDFDKLTLTFDANRLNMQSYDPENKTTDTKVFSHITLGSNTKINKDGIHIVGFASDTTFKLGTDGTATDVYLVNLDENTNDLEILKKHDQWHRTANGWEYSDTTENGAALNFFVNTTLDADANGAPIGVSVVRGSKDAENASGTIVIDTSKVDNASLITFASATKTGSSTGVHISLDGGDWGLSENDVTFQFASSTGTVKSTYYMKELDGDSSTGYELLIANSDWSLTNSGDHNNLRTWTYVGDSKLSFDVKPKTTADDGLKADSSTGAPIGVAVENVTISGSGKNAVTGFVLKFGDTGTTDAAAAFGDEITNNVSTDQVVFKTVTTGVNGVHLAGLQGSETTDGSSFAYTTDTTKMFTLGTDDDAKKYYLANINSTTAGGIANAYELLKNDSAWHRHENGWSFTDTSIDLAFSVNSDTKLIDNSSSELGYILNASTVTADEGKPLGITVTATDSDKRIVINTDLKVARALVFDSSTTEIDGNLHISLAGGSATQKEFRFRTLGTGDAPATDTTYYIVDADHVTNNGSEFYMKDDDSSTGIWIRTADGWDYFTSDTGITRDNYLTNASLAFRINFTDSDSDGYKAGDAGSSVPADITVTTETNVITWTGNEAPVGLNNIMLYKDRFSMNVASDTNNVGAITFASPRFKGNTSVDGYEEGAAIGVYDSSTKKTVATYQLYNADGNISNGLELTYNGWTNYQSDGKTFYAYVQGTDQTHNKNTGFAITFAADVLTTATAGYASLPAPLEAESNTFKLSSSTDPKKGVVLSKLTSENFHVAQFSDVGVIASGTTIQIGNNSYMLKEVDRTANNGFELTDAEGNWAKSSTNARMYYVGDGSETAQFTLAATSAFDSNNDFKPDFVDDVSTSTGKITLTLNNTVTGFAFHVNSTNSDTIAAKINVNIGDAVYTLGSGATQSGGYSEYKLVASGASEQLPANNAYAWSGYEVEDLINYDNGASLSSELDEILEPDAIGTAETFEIASADDILTGVATNDKSINSLTKSARHKARK